MSIAYRAPRSQLEIHSFPFKAMGSPCEITLYANCLDDAQRVADLVIAEVKRLEKKYSRYRDDSVTGTINRSAGKPIFVDIDEETDALLNYANAAYELSDGLFDITAGVLRKAWNFREAIIPSAEELSPLLDLIGWNQVERKKLAVRLPKVGMELDFGGYVKEYAVDKAVGICRENNIAHGLVDLGGDLGIVGPHQDGSPWRIGIRNPRNPQSAIGFIELSSGALASSGNYERFFEKDGRRYCHILNPKTGFPVEGLAAVSVAAQQCIVAGTSTTVAMLQSESEGVSFLNRMQLPYLAVRKNLSLEGTILAIQS